MIHYEKYVAVAFISHNQAVNVLWWNYRRLLYHEHIWGSWERGKAS